MDKSFADEPNFALYRLIATRPIRRHVELDAVIGCLSSVSAAIRRQLRYSRRLIQSPTLKRSAIQPPCRMNRVHVITTTRKTGAPPERRQMRLPRGPSSSRT